MYGMCDWITDHRAQEQSKSSCEHLQRKADQRNQPGRSTLIEEGLLQLLKKLTVRSLQTAAAGQWVVTGAHRHGPAAAVTLCRAAARPSDAGGALPATSIADASRARDMSHVVLALGPTNKLFNVRSLENDVPRLQVVGEIRCTIDLIDYSRARKRPVPYYRPSPSPFSSSPYSRITRSPTESVWWYFCWALHLNHSTSQRTSAAINIAL